MNRFNIVESFLSINGEGPRSGELALFIRFKGCNLNCSYCDTGWANEKNTKCKSLTKEEILILVNNSVAMNITITGGEPLFQPGILQLLEYICKNTLKVIEIETNGSIDIESCKSIENPPLLTMDYKLPSSGESSNMNINNFDHLTEKDSVKFVIGDSNDLIKAEDIIYRHSLQGKVSIFFSPVFGQIEMEEIVNFIKDRELKGVKFQLQLHKYVWHPDKIGV